MSSIQLSGRPLELFQSADRSLDRLVDNAAELENLLTESARPNLEQTRQIRHQKGVVARGVARAVAEQLFFFADPSVGGSTPGMAAAISGAQAALRAKRNTAVDLTQPVLHAASEALGQVKQHALTELRSVDALAKELLPEVALARGFDTLHQLDEHLGLYQEVMNGSVEHYAAAGGKRSDPRFREALEGARASVNALKNAIATQRTEVEARSLR
ncbi:MAG: hypothetical protein AAF658_09460 [Myxococcota bacterium]